MSEDTVNSADLDWGIRDQVTLLREAGIETFESCDGGEGHAFPEPTIRFHGGKGEGFRAMAVLIERGYRVDALRRSWPVIDGEPTGPYWEVTFWEESLEEKCKRLIAEEPGVFRRLGDE